MTPTEALAYVRYQINEATANFWSDAEIKQYMLVGETQLCGIVGYNQAITDQTTVTDQSTHVLPTDTLKIARVTYDGKVLKQVEPYEIDRRNGTDYGSTIETGPPEVYKKWHDRIYLFPVPQENKALVIDYYVAPDLTAETEGDVFTIQNKAIQQMIPDYAVMMCLNKDTESKLLPFWKQKWDENIQKAYSIADNEQHWNQRSTVRDSDYDDDEPSLWEIFKD